MRVATVFAGVASAAAFTAPANAQAVTKLVPTPRAMPQVTRAGSCHNASHWFTLYGYQSSAQTFPTDRCYGGVDPRGQVYSQIPPFRALSFCGGNNVGFFSGFTKGGEHLGDQRFKQSSNFYTFKPPKFPGSELWVSKIHISAFDGNQSCQG
jgi:hypothetical protein